MNPSSARPIVFSPTGTSKKIAEAIARSIAPGTCIDTTHTPVSGTPLAADTVAVVAVPVYGGHVAPTALKRLEALRGEGTPAVVVAVYGNRAFGSAVQELADFVTQRGFIPVAAAAFIAEHSYSSPETPIAAGRPDTQDLTAAAAFGEAVLQKLTAGPAAPICAYRLRTPRTPLVPMLRFIRFVLQYRRQQKRNPVVLLPQGDAARCTHCGRCAALCPTQAIARGEETKTDPARCIRCNACVKTCPVQARSYPTPFAAALARSFAKRKEPVTLL